MLPNNQFVRFKFIQSKIGEIQSVLNQYHARWYHAKVFQFGLMPELVPRSISTRNSKVTKLNSREDTYKGKIRILVSKCRRNYAQVGIIVSQVS